MGLFKKKQKREDKIPDEKIEKLRQDLLSKDYDTRNSVRGQAEHAAGRKEYPSFEQAYQANLKLDGAAKHQGPGQTAVNLCLEAIGLVPNFSAAHAYLAYLYRLYHNNHDLALKWARKAIEIDPKNEYAWHELGMAYVSLENAVDATMAFRKAVLLNPEIENTEPYGRLEHVYDFLGMQDQAFKCRERLARFGHMLEPSHARRWQKIILKADRQKLKNAAVSE
jgi:tetratricopeptide (TPR) repeat protein